MTVTQLTRKAGQARMNGLSAAQRQALARKGAYARRAKLSPEQRSESARKAALARWCVPKQPSVEPNSVPNVDSIAQNQDTDNGNACYQEACNGQKRLNRREIRYVLSQYGTGPVVYGLKDPRSDQLKYVGVTVNLARRYYKHVTGQSATRSPALLAWLKGLELEGLAPKLVVFRRTTLRSMYQDETEEIKKHSGLINRTVWPRKSMLA